MTLKQMIVTVLSAAALTLVVLSIACGGDDDDVSASDTGGPIVVPRDTGTVTPPPRRTFTPSPSPSPTPLEVCAGNPNPAPPEALQVEQPRPDARTNIPVHVRGWSNDIAEEGKSVFVSVVDQKQTVLQTNEVPAQPREFRVAPAGLEITEFTRPFGIDVVINGVTEETPVCIWVFKDVDEEGRALAVVQIPIVVTPN